MKKSIKEGVKKTFYVLAGIGALNWGLSYYLNLNLVQLLSVVSWLPGLVYTLVAIGGGLLLWDEILG